MRSLLLVLALVALVLSLSPTPASAQTLQFTDYTSGFTDTVPVSGINAEIEPIVYYTDLSTSFDIGVALLPGTGANLYNITVPSAVTLTSTNNPTTCTPSPSIVLSSTVPVCNYTVSWSSRYFGGRMTVTMLSLDQGGSWRDLVLTTFFILDPMPSSTSSPAAVTSARAPTSAAATSAAATSAPRSTPAATSTPLVTSTSPAVSSYPTASLCLISYSVPGSVDYPWSSATQLTVSYSPTTVHPSAGLTAVQLVSGAGTRTYTNKFGLTYTTALTLTSVTPNLLYLGNALPVDATGLTFATSSPLQLPGNGPMQLLSQLSVVNVSGMVTEVGGSRVDQPGQAFFSSVPGFVNVTIGASDVNSLAVNYSACSAPITFTNGLRTPTQPSVSNGAVHFTYSYYISDGATYSVVTNLSVTTASAFANTQDQLGNPYQTVTGVTGTRVYTSLADGATLTSAITGLSSGAAAVNASQRFYPYALLASAPGVYTMSNAPFLDAGGIAVTVNPSIPALGDSARSSVVYSTATLRLWSTQVRSAVVVDSVVQSTPLQTLQQQAYFLQ